MLIKISPEQMREALERFKVPTAAHSRVLEGEALSLFCENSEEHGAELKAPANASETAQKPSAADGEKVAALIEAAVSRKPREPFQSPRDEAMGKAVADLVERARGTVL